MLDGQIMRLIPAGVSKKTNKPYKAFYSCKCGQTAPGGYTLPNKSVGSVKQPNFANNSDLEARVKSVEARLTALESKGEINSADLPF